MYKADGDELRPLPGADCLDLRRLRYFVAVAEEMHFGRAADRIGIAQPPLSRQIARLESEVHAQLVDRSRSQIRLTQAGQALFDRARELFKQVDQIHQEMAHLGQGKAGRLRVAFVGSATHGILPSLIKSFRACHPDVEIALTAMNNSMLKQSLIQRDVDIAIARPSIVDEEVISEKLLDEPLILALPDALNDGRPSLIELATLRDETFILYPEHPRPSFADHILNICDAAGFRPKDPVMAMDYQTAVGLVSVGVGVSLFPQSVATSRRSGVAFRPYAGPNPGTALSVNFRTDNRSPQLWNFLAIARRYARRTTAPHAKHG